MNETIDLGGVTREAAVVRAGAGLGSLVRLTNGTLSTPLVDAGSPIDVAGTLTTGSPTLVLRSNLGMTVSGSIVGDMDVEAAGTFTGTNTYTGRTIVRRGLAVGEGGEILASRDIVIDGGVLALASTTTDPVNSRDVELRGGALWGSRGVGRVGRLALPEGHSSIGSDLDASLVAQSIVRSPGVTASMGVYAGVPAGLFVATPAAMSGAGGAPDRLPVLPWAIGYGVIADRSEWSFVTYDATGFRPLSPTTEYAPALADGANVRIAANATHASDVSVNTLSLRGSTLTLSNGARLTLAGGGLLMQPRLDGTGSAGITGDGSLALPAEGVVHTAPPTTPPTAQPYTIDVPVSGGMLTKTGQAVLALTRANTYSGGTTINQGTVRTGTPGALGTGAVRFAGGWLEVGYADGVVSNDLLIDGPDASLRMPEKGTTTFSGTVSGSGRLYLSGPIFGGGTFRFTGGGAPTGAYEVRDIGGNAVLLEGNFASPDAVFGSGNAGVTPTVYGGNGIVRGRFDGGVIRLSSGPLGNLPGRLTFGRAELDLDTVFHVDLAGPDAASGYDQLVVLDGLTMVDRPATLDLLVDPAFRPSLGQQFTVIDDRFTGPVVGAFRGLAEGSPLSAQGTSFRITYLGGDGNDVVLTVVPEPGMLAASALGGMMLLRRRHRRSGPL
jgi:autotransporter-associated beta strand protein